MNDPSDPQLDLDALRDLLTGELEVSHTSWILALDAASNPKDIDSVLEACKRVSVGGPVRGEPLLTDYQVEAIKNREGRTLRRDRWVLRGIRGSGNFAEIIDAYDVSLGRMDAMKCLGLRSSPSLRVRFRREAETLAHLRHPNLTHLRDKTKVDSFSPYFVMEHAGELNLSRLGRQRKKDDAFTSDAIKWLETLARTLRYLHSRGVIHRDIKPENIMLSSDGKLKLIDFNVAKIQGMETITEVGAFVGTPAFASPEQFYSPDDLGAASDIYSLGCTFFFLFTGRPPFKGKTREELGKAHKSDPRPSLISCGCDIPVWLNDIVLKMMQRYPHQRYRTAEELCAAIALAQPKKSDVNRCALDFLGAFNEFIVRVEIAVNEYGVADAASIHARLNHTHAALDRLLRLDVSPDHSQLLQLVDAVRRIRRLMRGVDSPQWAEGPWVDSISALFTGLLLYACYWARPEVGDWTDAGLEIARHLTDELTDWVSVFQSHDGACDFAQPFQIQLRRSLSTRVNGEYLPAVLHEAPLVSDDGVIRKWAFTEFLVALEKRTKYLCAANEQYGEIDRLTFFVSETLCPFLKAAVSLYERVEPARLLELAECFLLPVAGAIGVDRTAPFPALCDLVKCFQLFPLQINSQVRSELEPVLNRLRVRLEQWRLQAIENEVFREKLSYALEVLRPAIEDASRSSRRVSLSDRLQHLPVAERFHTHRRPLLVSMGKVRAYGLFDETHEDIPCEVECISRFDWGIRIAVVSRHQDHSPHDEELLLRFGRIIQPLDDCVVALPYADDTADGEQRWLVSKFTRAWSSSSIGGRVRIGGKLTSLLSRGSLVDAFCDYLSRRLGGDFNRG